MITVVATQTVRPGKEAALQELMVDLTAKVKAGEPGCITFDWVRDTADPHRALVIEQYADEAAYRHHIGTPYLAAFLPRLSACLTGEPAVTLCHDIVARPPSNGDCRHPRACLAMLQATHLPLPLRSAVAPPSSAGRAWSMCRIAAPQ